jgi:L-threonylcarbamoyladenylate synthase
MAEAIARLQAGDLVAFPTETVYGLGANALDPAAVARIYAAKGRPATNPLIVHVPDATAARERAGEWPAVAETLAAKFWPGPLTLVVKKADTVPAIVTAGGLTVGLRVPNHPVALELLRASGIPVAAPSANRSEEVSPTTAQHVADSLGPYVDDLLILDGGPCTVGLESTVLDVTADPPRILRPGMVNRRSLSPYLGTVIRETTPHEKRIVRSPGQMVRHYAPSVPVIVVPNSLYKTGRLLSRLTQSDGLLSFGPSDIEWKVRKIIQMPTEADEYAKRLYAALREMDDARVERIVIEAPSSGPKWAAVHDRLRRAAAPKDAENGT